MCGTDGFGEYIWFTEPSVAAAAATGSYSQLSGYCVTTCPQGAIDYGGKYSDFPDKPKSANIPTVNNFYRCVYGGDQAESTAFIVSADTNMKSNISRELKGMIRFAKPLFVVGFVVAPLLAVAYIMLLGVCGGCIVWGSLLILFALLCLATAVSGCMAGYWDVGKMARIDESSTATHIGHLHQFSCDPGQYKKGWVAMFYVFAVMTAVQICTVFCLCRYC